MALKPCEECKHAIKSDENLCPHCGKKQSGGKSHFGKYALVLFALVFGVWVFEVTGSDEPRGKISGAARPEKAPSAVARAAAPLSDLERMLQDRCGRQTDDNGNWIVKGAEDRARCRVQVELEMERNERAARAAEHPSDPPSPARLDPARGLEPASMANRTPDAVLPRVATLSRGARAPRGRARHDLAQKSSFTPSPAATNPPGNVPSEAPRPAAPSEPKGGLDPGDDLTPLAPIGASAGRDPVPGEPMTVKPDGAFL